MSVPCTLLHRALPRRGLRASHSGRVRTWCPRPGRSAELLFLVCLLLRRPGLSARGGLLLGGTILVGKAAGARFLRIPLRSQLHSQGSLLVQRAPTPRIAPRHALKFRALIGVRPQGPR